MQQGLPCIITQRQEWSPELCSLQFAAPDNGHFTAGQFVRIGLELGEEFVARPYSLVNAPGDETWEIYFNRVPEGPLSNALWTLSEGDCLWATPTGNGFFCLNEVPKARQLWLMATGTGIGPYLSMLQTLQPWQTYSQIVLVHGIKQKADQAYGTWLEQWQAKHPGQFQYLYAISRETVAGTFNQRMTQALTSGWLEQVSGLNINADDSQVMLCGHPNMIREMSGLLQTRGLAKNRRRTPGQITTEIYR